jgi:hypothetical protein
MWSDDTFEESLWWLARAEQARRIARMLAGHDAALAEAYAQECEARAVHFADRGKAQPLAA